MIRSTNISAHVLRDSYQDRQGIQVLFSQGWEQGRSRGSPEPEALAYNRDKRPVLESPQARRRQAYSQYKGDSLHSSEVLPGTSPEHNAS